MIKSKLKKWIILLISILFVLSVNFSIKNSKSYDSYVNEFTHIDLEGLSQKISRKDSFFLFLGKETCPACVEFVPKLVDAKNEESAEVYYLDVNKYKGQKEYEKFKMKYNLKYVPSILIFNEKGELQIPNVPENKKEIKLLLKEL